MLPFLDFVLPGCFRHFLGGNDQHFADLAQLQQRGNGGKKYHLIGLKENVIIGKIIPAGTGMARYRNIEPLSVNEVEVIENIAVDEAIVESSED